MISIFNKLLTELAFSDFNITNIEVHNLIFSNNHIVDYWKNGRKQHLLHLMFAGRRTYYTNQQEMQIEGQNALFIPNGTAYYTKAHSINETDCSGIGVSFDATFKDGTYLEFPKGIYFDSCTSKTKELFLEIDKVYKEIPLKYSKLKALTLELISHLAKEKNNELYIVIKPALDLMATTFTNNLPIKTYAEKCNLSESYFRKIFKTVVGISPIEYRNELRFAKAEELYQNGNNIKQIAETVGFCDEVFFSKAYKKRFGTSIKNRLKTV